MALGLKIDDAAKTVRAVALDALSGVVNMSPVDTGRFRGNWGAATGTVPTDTFETTTGSASLERGGAIIRDYPKRGFPVLTLYNNLPYAESLENGHSKQAPKGMVAVTIANITAAYDGREV